MPKINLDDKNAMQRLDDYLQIINPVAVEFKFASDLNRLPYDVKNAMKGRARIWYNTLWNTHAGGHDDDCSLVDPDEGYGYLIDSLGASILQTDRPAYLINYLKKKELKKKWECIENWDYLSVENEWTMQTSPNFDVEEVFLKGKHTPATNEDGIIVTPYFAAVIDGATAKSELEIDGKKTGRIAMELVIEAIHDFPKDIDANEALKRITEKIHSFYVQHRLLEELEKTPGSRFTANGVIYSYEKNEIWQIGDCQCLFGNTYSSNEKEIDAIMANARAVVNEIALLNGATPDDLLSNDPGRNFIYRFLQHISSSEYTKLDKKLQDQYADLLKNQVSNNVEIYYHDKLLRHHSIGQRASALILFILMQSDNDIILIDQPEDDLDNKIIYDEVITAIAKKKQDIQFIFATHNANIPVLGDAERIFVVEYQDTTIDISQGNIDLKSTHKQIVDIMEGGEEAFDKRQLIYTSWK